MALKFVEKTDKTEKTPEKLPEGADRFLWNEVPVAERPPIKKSDYAWILKGEKPSA
jgi:hypothetical protein